eukprot:SAG22_NODE_1792_length_3564_cov_3.463203_1_plen_226_part_10
MSKDMEGLLCPITCEVMRDPVILAGDGHTYERTVIEQWLQQGSDISPATGASLAGNTRLFSNIALRKTIEQMEASGMLDPEDIYTAPSGGASAGSQVSFPAGGGAAQTVAADPADVQLAAAAAAYAAAPGAPPKKPPPASGGAAGDAAAEASGSPGLAHADFKAGAAHFDNTGTTGYAAHESATFAKPKTQFRSPATNWTSKPATFKSGGGGGGGLFGGLFSGGGG